MILGPPPVNTPMYTESGQMEDVWKRWFDAQYRILGGATAEFAPSDVSYIVQTASDGLSNEQALSSLQNGYTFVTLGTGELNSRVMTGTADRITITYGDGILGNTTYDIASTYVGQTSITTLGTITTGTWNGTALITTYGGTGLTTYTQGDIVYYTSGTTLSKLAKSTSATRYLSNQGTDNAPSWNQVNLTNGVTGTLPVASGGTAVTSLGDLTKADDTNITLTLGGTPTGALITSASITAGWTGTLAVARGGTGTGSAGITAFNNITGYTAAGATGTTSTNLVFSTSPTLVTPLLGTPTSGTLTNCTGYVEANVVFTDVTTNNSSTSNHGFLKKLSNTATEYMDGTGNWSTPAGVGSGVTVIATTVYTSGTNSFTPNANTLYAIIELVGGGGGSGGVTNGGGNYTPVTGGGGSGGYSRRVVSRATLVGAGTQAEVIIGAAGAAGSAGNNAGGTGGNSTVKANNGAGSTLMTANGGVGSAGNGTTSSTGGYGPGGAGGTASSGDVNTSGQAGGNGSSIVTSVIMANGGFGGSNPLGNGGIGEVDFGGTITAGGVAVGYGSGGGGKVGDASSSLAGVAGNAGVCIITEYRSS